VNSSFIIKQNQIKIVYHSGTVSSWACQSRMSARFRPSLQTGAPGNSKVCYLACY